ncbi:hypothetical protein [Streptomyces sp. WM6378]|uniref:hypothetical protein n=1 Tax=Streptomyces sp. WM6378 TaxID=1415557 RepID=UPI000AE656A6|nr:hypothetical protein [Streptomyces sp. WM6378]
MTFHHTIRCAVASITASLPRLHGLTQNGDDAYSVDIAHFMAGNPMPRPGSRPRWFDGEATTPERWSANVAQQKQARSADVNGPCCAEPFALSTVNRPRRLRPGGSVLPRRRRPRSTPAGDATASLPDVNVRLSRGLQPLLAPAQSQDVPAGN